MYDLEILIPAETTLVERFINLKKWGFVNVGNNKVKIMFVMSHDNDSSILESGWSEGIDVEIIKTPYKHVAQRIYYYYDSIINTDTAKWYMRIDEDSMNDIDGLMENLNNLFDYNREYHITGKLNWDSHIVDREILISLGYEFWYKNHNCFPPHAYEISITSNAAVKRILSNEDAKNYFSQRKQIANGYGDHGLCLCARMEKIHPTMVKFLTPDAEIKNFSNFGGNYNHIHHISKENYNWFNSLDESKNHEFENYSFLWTNKKNNSRKLIKLIDKKRIIEIGLNNNSNNVLGIWGVNNEGKLTLYFQTNQPCLIFEKTETNESIIYNNEFNELKTGDISSLLN